MKPIKLLCHTALFSLLSICAVAQNNPKPKLIVQIVVSQMRYDYLSRFSNNFTEGGFHTLIDSSANFSNAHYRYMLTNTPAGLATLSTGANPAEHGVIGEQWFDFTTGNLVNLIEDESVRGLDCDDGVGRYSPHRLSAATLGDRLKESNPKSKVISLASSPVSAIVSGGALGDVYWVDPERGDWISSSFYFEDLPHWVREYNKTKPYTLYADRTWAPSKPQENYVNSNYSLLTFDSEKRSFGSEFVDKVRSVFKFSETKADIAALQYTPYNNSLTTLFAQEAIIREELGQDENTDLLTLCYDTPRWVSERFGPSSIELEDTYYKLDAELRDLLQFIYAHNKREEVLVIFTSDHGSSDTFREDSRIPKGRFNTEQFKMIMNGFLSAQFEPGTWVVGYHNRQIYLNRSIIYTYGFNLADVQSRAAAFALQFQGVSSAQTATSMQNGYFAGGYTEKMQNSFYPKRGGDVTINLMPGWIEDDDGKVSLSGSLYEYDTHVPLMFLGAGLQPAYIERNIDMTGVAPTLARLLNITPPNASIGEAIPEVLPTQNH